MSKILLYTHALTGGGAERVWALLASGLNQRGHDVILATDFDAPQNQKFVSPGVRQASLGGSHVAGVFQLARLLREERPDVSMSALGACNLKHAAAAALARRSSRAVLSWHGYASSEPQALSRLGFLAAPLITRMTAATVSVSDGLKDYMISRWRADAAKSRRIYNLVDGGPLPPAANAAELAARPPVALAAGRFVPYKEFPLLVRAFARVAPPNARLVILGEGPEKPAVEAEIARLGLQGRVDLPGYASAPWDWYARARVFVLPSSQEPFGLVVVEALANGLSVVASDCDGPREILGHGEYGALPPRGDEEALARAIGAALANPGDPAPRVERARLFSMDRGLDAYEALIGDIIARNEAQGRFGEPAGIARRDERVTGAAAPAGDG